MKTSEEKDQGFNESHGYPPGHGGPTGPGDAPAPSSDAHDTARTATEGDRTENDAHETSRRSTSDPHPDSRRG